MKKGSLKLASAVCAIGAFAATGTAQAQDEAAAPATGTATANGSGDIVVTAQRREQNLEKTPIAITALTGPMLEQRGVTQLQNIAASTPGLQITNVTASPNAILVSLRGAMENNGGSITSESPVAIYIDDVYQSRLSAANYDLADIVRVEVLRGPQGTLYGRNSMTGAIKLVTRQPDGSRWINTDVSVGSYQETKIKTSIGTPITDHLAVAASGFYDNRNNGWQYDEALGEKVGKYRKYGGQVALGITNVSGLEAVLTARYGVSLTDGMYFVPVDYATNASSLGNFYDTNSPRKANGDTWQKSLSLKLGYDLGSVTIRSISAYQHLKDNWALDFSGGYYLPGSDQPTTGFYRTSFARQHQFTQEFQALGKAFDNRLNWIVGAFYFDEHANQTLPEDDLGAFYLTYQPTKFSSQSRSLAFYGQADYALSDKLTVSVGIRHSHDVKHFQSLTPDAAGPDANLVAGTDKTSASVWTPRFNVQYDLNRDIMVYATVAKGYRAGGFNSLVLANPSLFGTPYKPESVWSYEGGIKIQALGHRAHLNLAGYYEDLSDLQTLADAGSGSFIYQNAASAKVWGVEVEAGLQPVKGLNLFASGAWTDDKYGKLDPSSEAAQYGADKLPMIAHWQYQVGGTYEVGLQQAGSLVLASDYSYRSAYNMSVTLDPYARVSPIGRANASITWKSEQDHWEVYLQSKNVLNSKDYYAQNNFIAGVFAYKAAMEPRTFMAGFRFKY